MLTALHPERKPFPLTKRKRHKHTTMLTLARLKRWLCSQVVEQARVDNAEGKLIVLHPKRKLPFPLTERKQQKHTITPLYKSKTLTVFRSQVAEQARKENAEGKLTALHPKRKLPFPLTERKQLSHNVFLFRFGLPSEEHTLGLPVGQHVFIYGKVRLTRCWYFASQHLA